MSVQTTPQKPARPDPSPPSDSFAALVDNNTATGAGKDAAPLPAPDRPAPARQADEASATTDNKSPRNASSTDQSGAPNNSSDPNTGTDRSAGSTTAANASASTDPSQPTDTKSSAKSGPKTGATKSAAKETSNGGASPDQSAATQQGGATALTALNGIAVAIPVAVAPVNIAVTVSASANSDPLAIAAAAITASSSAAAAPGVTPAQPKDSSVATPAAAPSATTPVTTTTSGLTVDAGATTQAAVQAGASAAIATPTKQAAVQTGAAAASNPSLPALVEAAVPVAPKATSAKAGVAPEAKTGSSPTSDTTSEVSDKSTTAVSPAPALNTAAPQPAAPAKPETGDSLAEAAKANISEGASLSVAPTGRDRAAGVASGPTPAASSDINVQATATLQPQLSSASTGPASTATLSATAATGAAVPVGGLALEIAASVKSGKTRFEIRLDPADLGRIDVRIDVDRNGQVTSHLTVEKPETLSMLQQDAPQLQRALDDAGLKTGAGGLQFSLRDQSSSGQNNGNQTAGNAQRLVVSDEDTIPALVAGRSYGRMLGASGGVDIRV